jgi:hypothetical protein
MPKKKRRNVVVVNKKKKPLVKIIINPSTKKKLPIIRTKKGVKVISKNNVIKNKSENWLQKSKLISSVLGTSSNPIAKIGLHFAQSHGYGRRRIYGGSTRRINQPSDIVPIKKPSWGSKARNVMSKYGKYAIPIAMAAMVASRGTKHHEIPYAGDALRAQYERF